MLGTRPDIAYAVTRMSQFAANPSEEHLKCAVAICRYLVGTQHYSLIYDGHSNIGITAFSDSDWGGCPDDIGFTNGFGIFLSKSLISWMAKNQQVVARSSAKSEYRAIANVAAELLWIKSLLYELGFPCNHKPIL